MVVMFVPSLAGPGQLWTRTTLTASPRAWAATASLILANGIIVMILSKGNAPAWYISMSRGMKTSGLLSPSTIPLNDRPLSCISMRPTDSMAVGSAGTPTMPNWPCWARQEMTAAMTGSAAVVSSAYLTPSGRTARTCSAMSPSAGSIAWVAPRESASSRRAAAGSATMRVARPREAAAITAESPTEPAPVTSSEEPGGQSSELSTAPAPVWMPHPSGPASSSGRPPGILTTLASYTRAWVANEDWPKKLPPTSAGPSRSVAVPRLPTPAKFSSMKRTQYDGNPAVHSEQAPQLLNVAPTRSPGTTLVTPGPTDFTTPLPSWPSTAGNGKGR